MKNFKNFLAIAAAMVADYRDQLWPFDGAEPVNAVTNSPVATSFFEIRRRHLGDPMSRIFPSGYVSVNAGALVYPRGTAVGAAGAAAVQGDIQDIWGGLPASGSNFLGFLTRDCVDGGPTLLEVDIPANYPMGLPFTAGLECTLEKGEEVECEGASYINSSGVGGNPAPAITAATALGTKLSFDGTGRFYIAQSGDTAYFELTGNSGLPGNGPVPINPANLRILAEKIGP